MLLFLSYARDDRSSVGSLVAGLELLHHEVWLDDELTGGQRWWDKILSSIRQCDAFLSLLSPAAVDSQACMLERRYAQDLGKPVLPVMVAPVLEHLLPPDLAVVQFVDYTAPGETAAFRLAGALAMLPSAPPLPEVLPASPPVPISYLSELAQRVVAPNLTLDDQLALVSRLRMALQRGEERDAAIGLLGRLQKRDDLYHVPATELMQLIAQSQSNGPGLEERKAPSGTQTSQEPGSAPAGGTDWRVQLVSKDDENRALSIIRRRSHELSVLTKRQMGAYEELHLNGRLVEKTKATDAWKRLWQFEIEDDGETIPVKIHVVRTFWAGRITSFGVEIEGKQVYSDTG